MSVKIFFNTNAGFRGISTIYEQTSQFLDIDTVSYGCIRQWILRIGFGLLQEPIEKRTDWIYVVDFSIQLGKERCLLILGVTKESLLQNGYQLKHNNVRVLDIYVQEHFDAQKVYERLTMTKEKTGAPYQIISDKGRDICKGIDNFCLGNKSVISTNDVTHMIGIVLKHHLENDTRWINLQADLLSLTQQVKQTELSFLRPIAMCPKARWLNINKEIGYLENIYQYKDNKDFSLISGDIKIENTREIFEVLKVKCKNKNEEKRLMKELENNFTDKKTAIEMVTARGPINARQIKFEDAGESRFTEKFAVLDKHRNYFNELKQINHIAEKIKCTIREKGLSLDTLQEIEMFYDNITYPMAKQIYYEINNNLQSEQSKCGIDKVPILCCSEIIESIFGKFKMKSKQTVGGIYQTVLSIVLICSEITPETIMRILPKVKMSDVEKWFFSMSGMSNLTKRRIAFG